MLYKGHITTHNAKVISENRININTIATVTKQSSKCYSTAKGNTCIAEPKLEDYPLLNLVKN